MKIRLTKAVAGLAKGAVVEVGNQVSPASAQKMIMRGEAVPADSETVQAAPENRARKSGLVR